ncbi:hypothetical protein [Variovorax sp. KBW07]|nr:hypothetical protein [Variovorax sp. KBW07]
MPERRVRRCVPALHLQGEQICGKSVRALAAEHHLVERQVARIVADVAF